MNGVSTNDHKYLMGVVLLSAVTSRLGTVLSTVGAFSKLEVEAGLLMADLRRVWPAVNGPCISHCLLAYLVCPLESFCFLVSEFGTLWYLDLLYLFFRNFPLSFLPRSGG